MKNVFKNANEESYWDFFSTISSLPRHICSPSYNTSIRRIADKYNLEILRYTCDTVINGWTVPPGYHVKKATISIDGDVLYDGTAHALGVISHSAPFQGVVSREELIGHCHTDSRDDDWIPYHFRQSYRPWDRDWGFCLPKRVVANLPEGPFDVSIEIEENDPELLIATGKVKGTYGPTFTLIAHLDHPGQANDDLSGVMAICETIRRKQGTKLNYGIDILIVPEIIGSVYHLHSLAPKDIPTEALFVESIGQSGSFQLQSSLTKSRVVEHCCQKALSSLNPDASLVRFGHNYTNDEAVFESYGCPTPSLTRGKFAGYHSNQDTFARLDKDCVEETIAVLTRTIDCIQDLTLLKKNFRGTVCCSNPDLNLYIDPGQQALGTAPDSKELRNVMDYLMRPEPVMCLDQIVQDCGVPATDALEYLKRWKRAGLIDFPEA